MAGELLGLALVGLAMAARGKGSGSSPAPVAPQGRPPPVYVTKERAKSGEWRLDERPELHPPGAIKVRSVKWGDAWNNHGILQTEWLTKFYGPPDWLSWNGRAFKSWQEVWELKERVQAFRRKADKASSSSSWFSLAVTDRVPHAWWWDDLAGFAQWINAGGEKHVAAVEKELRRNGGNQSAFGGIVEGLADLLAGAAGVLAFVPGGQLVAAGAAAASAGLNAVSSAAKGDVEAAWNNASTAWEGVQGI